MDSMGEFPEKRFPNPQRWEEVDFSIWIEDAGRVDIEVKSGSYCVGEWLTEGPDSGGGDLDDRAA